MLKNICRALMLAAYIVSSLTPATAEQERLIPDNTFGTEPPSTVSEWTRISVLGIRNHLYLIIWISPQSFPRAGFERLVVLSPDEYRAIGNVAGGYDCLEPFARFPESKAILVSEYIAAKGERSCRLPSAASCEFLSKLAALPGIGGVAKHEDAIRDFSAEFNCSLGKAE